MLKHTVRGCQEQKHYRLCKPLLWGKLKVILYILKTILKCNKSCGGYSPNCLGLVHLSKAKDWSQFSTRMPFNTLIKYFIWPLNHPFSSRRPTVSILVLNLCSLMTWSSASGSDRSSRLQELCSSVWRRRGLYWAEWSDPQGLSVVPHVPQLITVINWIII